MGFLGKVLVGLQFALSILFLTFAGAVFTAQQNWKAQKELSDTKITQLEGEKKNIEDEFRKSKTIADMDLANEKQKAAEAAGKAKLFEDDLTTARAELQAAKNDVGVQRRLADVAKEEAQQRRDEAITQRGVNNDLNKLLNEKNDKVKALEDIVFNSNVELKTTKDKHEKLLAELAILQKVIAANGLPTDPKAIAGLQTPPPAVDGAVLETKRGGRNGADLVEISVGSDDGLTEGHKLVIFRQAVGERAAKYLGEIRLVYVTPDRAVGTVVTRAKNGIIEKGDNVTSKL